MYVETIIIEWKKSMELAVTYMEKMKRLLKKDYEDYLASFDEEAIYGLRVNTLKVQSDEFEKIAPLLLQRIPWTEEGYYYHSDEQPAKHPYYYAGLYYIQEPSAMMPVACMPIQKGDLVLDLCAAPGGKSTQIAAKLQGEGLLVSNDISASRSKAVVKNVEICGVKNAVVVSEDPAKLVEYFPYYFDHILVDAPCSGEGMFRKKPKMAKEWTVETNGYYAEIQKGLLEQADAMLKASGTLTYSTCTFAKEENEDVIQWFLERNNNYEIVKIHFDTAIGENIRNHYTDHEDLKNTLRLMPFKIKGEGHFVAVLRKKENSTGSTHNKYKVETKKNRTAFSDLINEKEIESFFEFVKCFTHLNFDKKRLCRIKDKLYYLPENMPYVKGLRVLRNGWLLGELKRGRFEPSQAFASGVHKNEVKNVVNLASNNGDTIKYLKGESIRIEANKGYNLVCVDGFALGWAKKNGPMLKNKYAVGWRWQ